MANNAPAAPAGQTGSQSPKPITQSKPATKKSKKKGGCLIFLLALLFIAGFIAVFTFRLPQKLGWVKGPGTRFTSMTHERLTAQEIVAEAESKGFKSKGAQVYVFPKPDSGEAVLYASFDPSKGFEASSGPYDPVVSTLVLLGGGEKAKEYAVTHLGAEFHDEEGNLLFSAVVTTSDIRELAEGRIAEEEFMKRVDRVFDLPNLAKRVVIPF